MSDIKKIVTTNRLYLRKIDILDADVFFQYMKNEEDNEFMNFKYPMTLQYCRGFISNLLPHTTRKLFAFCICKHDTNQQIGYIYLKPSCNEKSYECLMWIAKPFRNQKYGQEILKAFIKFCLIECNIQNIFCLATKENIQSNKMVQKSGFIFEGTLRKRRCYKKQLRDIQSYSIMREDLE